MSYFADLGIIVQSFLDRQYSYSLPKNLLQLASRTSGFDLLAPELTSHHNAIAERNIQTIMVIAEP
jgi:hypothetical protein